MKVTKNYGVSPIPMKSLAIGEAMEVMEGSDRLLGHILLCTYIGIIDLNDPRTTWTGGLIANSYIKGRILKPGESITLTVEPFTHDYAG